MIILRKETDPDILRYYGWGQDGKPVPSYVIAKEGLWEQWRERFLSVKK